MANQQSNTSGTTPSNADIVEVFGSIGDGLQATTTTSPARLQTLRHQWQRRRNLAELMRFPEGFAFPIAGNVERDIEAVLLTPPHGIAVQRSDGTWERTARTLGEDSDQPPPYTLEWYRQYLDAMRLPQWLFTTEHLAMLDNSDEADALDMPNTPSGLFRNLPPRDYLNMQYPSPPHQIRPRVFGNGAFRVKISSRFYSRMQRRFPALGVAGPGCLVESTGVVLPSGHLQLRTNGFRDRIRPALRLASASKLHFTREGRDLGPASYEIESQDDVPLVQPINVDGQPCDPTNDHVDNGQDQTGGISASYHTRTINGRTITLDRSPVVVGREEDHKRWIVTKVGHFRPRATKDPHKWDDPGWVDRLNKWRNLELYRNGWAKLRQDSRPDYSQAERKWLMDMIEEVYPNKLEVDMDKLMDDFNTRFQPTRNKTALKSLMTRLRDECSKKCKPGGSDDDEEDTSKKRKKRKTKEREDESEDGGDRSSKKKREKRKAKESEDERGDEVSNKRKKRKEGEGGGAGGEDDEEDAEFEAD